MADPVVKRISALAFAPAITTNVVSVTPLEPGDRFSLRMRLAPDVTPLRAPPPHFDMPLNTCAVRQDCTIARLGPDEWLFLGSSEATEILLQQLRTALAGEVHSFVDISHRYVGIQVGGQHAREVINAGCPLDLHDAAFPGSSATRTLLGKSEIILLRPAAELSFRVECARSFAPYVYAFLKNATREFAPD